MSYVDGFLIPVKTARKDDYIKLARESWPMFQEHGALKLVENWGDNVPEGKITSFPMAVKCEADETVVFSWIIWPSKEAREKGMKAVQEDPRMDQLPGDMPFDGKRMIFGGFQTVFEG